MPPNHYLVIDFEATCCDKGTFSRTEMEIIEIGAVMVNAVNLEVFSEYQSFIRPTRNSKLTAFCTDLTSIRQQDVDSASVFVDVISHFKSWLDQYEGYIFCSWGDYDLNQLKQDCEFHNVPCPINAPHLNVKRRFADRQQLLKKPGLGQAIRMANLEFTGTHHRGIDDARNIARLLPFIFGEARLGH